MLMMMVLLLLLMMMDGASFMMYDWRLLILDLQSMIDD